MEEIGTVLNHISHEWELEVNKTELVSAIHVLQGFVLQHALQRTDPENWNSWFKEIT